MVKKKVERQEIDDDHDLHRRIAEEDYNHRSDRATYGYFYLREDINEDSLSVNWDLLATPKKSSYNPTTKCNDYVVSVKARVPRFHQWPVEHKPSKRNPAHSGIFTDKSKNLTCSRTLSQASRLTYKP